MTRLAFLVALALGLPSMGVSQLWKKPCCSVSRVTLADSAQVYWSAGVDSARLNKRTGVLKTWPWTRLDSVVDKRCFMRADGYTIVLDKHNLALTQSGASDTLTATVTYCHGVPVPNVQMTWTVRNTTIVNAITSKATKVGVVPKAATGTGYVYVTSDGGGADSALITVNTSCVGSPTNFCPGDDLNAKVQAAPSGTSFTFTAGTYRQQQITPKANDTFTGTGSTTILTGSSVLTGWASDGAGHWFVGNQTQQNTTFGVPPCAAGHDGCNLNEQLWVNDSLYEHVSTLAAMGPARTWYFDYTADKIYLPFDPTDSTVETSVSIQAFNAASVSGLTVKNLLIQRYANSSQTGALQCGTSCTVTGVTTRWNHGAGLRTGGTSLVRNDTITANGQIGLIMSGTGGTADTNVITWNNTAFYGRGTSVELGGSKFATVINQMIRGNYVAHNFGPALWCDANCQNVTFQDNVVDSNDWKGIFYEVSYSATIFGNTAIGNGTIYSGPRTRCDGAGIQVVNSRDVEIYNNTVTNNRSGICGEDSDRPTPTPPAGLGTHDVVNMFVHNNTITQPDSTAAGINDGDAGTGDPYSAAANNVWQNNTYFIGANTTFRWNNLNNTWATWFALPQDVGSTESGQ